MESRLCAVFWFDQVELRFELRRGERQGRGQLGASLAQILCLLASSSCQLAFYCIADFCKSLAQTISHLLAQIALGIFQPGGHVGGGGSETL